MPCKGIQCGDLGPKLGYNSKDNGWLSFDHVRIPRSQMLQKFVSVDREGEFSIDGDLRVLYSTMMSVRRTLIEGAGYILSQVCLIGIRYSCVRRQFKNTTGSKEETKLIDYQTQQMKLFPLVSMAKVQHTCSRYINARHDKMLEEIEKENFDSLDELHHLTSGFKSLHSQQTYEGLLQVRQALGGAGYSAWSGIPQMIDNFSPQVTFEGDNTVMLIQSTRYLKKLYKKARKGTVISSPVFEYLNHVDANLQKVCSAKTSEDLCSASLVLEALEVNASHHIKSTFTQIEESKAPAKQAENDLFALGLLKMALAHLYAVASKMAELEHLASELKCANARIHADNIRILYGLSQLQKDPAGLYECGYFAPGSRAMVDGAVKLVLARLRPQILPLAEVVPHPDGLLMSAIGNSYGDIYETHLEWAATSRLNDDKGSIPDGYMEHIMPILQGKL
jgi:acyl-CoA oxidase